MLKSLTFYELFLLMPLRLFYYICITVVEGFTT